MVAGGTISFGGLASGLDTKSIVEQLTNLKKLQLITPLQKVVDSNKDKIDAYKPIFAAYQDLQQKARLLKNTDNSAWNVKSGVSSNTDVVLLTAIQSNQASKGTYTISNITQLAQPDRVYFNGVADKTTTQFGEGTFTLTYKGASTDIAIDSTNNTLQGITTAINNANAGVTANIVNDGTTGTPYRLVLTSATTGDDTTITQNIDSILTLVTDAATSSDAINEPQDAEFLLNGLSISSNTNVVSDAIQGATFSLLGTDPTGTTTITIKQDNDKIAKGITDFINSYATLKNLLQSAGSIDPETGRFGVLGQDSIVSQSNIRIGSLFSKTFNSLSPTGFRSLSQIGITNDVYGKVQVDSSKLNTALENKLSDVQALFQGSSSEDGIAKGMYDYMDALSNSSGIMIKKRDNLNQSTKRLEQQMRVRQSTVDTYEQRLFSKYNLLERTLSQLQNQQAAVESFSGIYSNSANRLL